MVLGLVVVGRCMISAVNFHFVLSLFRSLFSGTQVYDDERLLARNLFTKAHIQAAGGGFGPHSHAGKPRGETDGHVHAHTHTEIHNTYFVHVHRSCSHIFLQSWNLSVEVYSGFSLQD